MDTPSLKYKVRAGTLDSGREYEFKMAALLFLRCLHPEVSDAWMASNAEGVGAFDDLILQVTLSDNETVTYMLQLKHQDKPRNVLEKEFLQPKGDFSLSKYFKDIDKLYHSINSNSEKETFIKNLGKFSNVHFVLFTNRNVNTCNFLEQCNDCNLSFIQTVPAKALFKLNIAQLPNDHTLNADRYFNVYLLPNQVSAKHIDKEMEEELVKVGGMLDFSFTNIRNVSDKYVKYITDWAKGNLGGHYGLTKKDVLCKLAELMFSQYEVDLTRQQFLNYDQMEETVWNEIFHTHAVTVVNSSDYVFKFLIQYLQNEVAKYCNEPIKYWTHGVSTEEQNRFYHQYPFLKANMLKLVGNNGKITVSDIYKCLWISGNCPLLLKITGKHDYENIMNILKWSNFRVILINSSNDDLTTYTQGMKHFHSLLDMDDEVRKKILHHPVKLQGRSFARLDNLIDESMFQHFKCQDIINILLNNFDIGTTLKPLPPYFIGRSVSKIFLRPEVLNDVKNEMFLLSNYSEKYHNQLPVENSEICKLEEVDLSNLSKNRIIVINHTNELKQANIQNYAESTIHHLSIYDKHHLEWKWSTGSTNTIRSFRIPFEKYESNIEHYFCNPTNIISEVPGMGKSVLLDFIAQEAPIDKWVLRIDLNRHQKYYRNDNCKHTKTNASKHLKYFYEALLDQHQPNIKLDEMVFQKLVKSRNVIVLLDGFDEVSVSYKDAVTNILTSLHRDDYQIWLTTRPHMKFYLEQEFGTFSISLKPFTVENQEQFLIKYFSSRNSHLISSSGIDITEFSNKLLEASRKNLLDRDAKFTGIPLQTQLLADFFDDKFRACLLSGAAFNFNENFDLLGLYQNFIDNKFNMLCERFGEAIIDAHVMFKEHQSLFALQLVFRLDDFEEMDIFKKLNEYYKNETNKIQVLQRDGVITVDEEQNVSCIHRTFAEYLAARWLSDNLNSANAEIKEFSHNLIQQRFSEDHQFLFSMFDRLLAKDYPLHMAIINGQVDDAAKIINSDSYSSTEIDRGGRSVLHVLALYGLQLPSPYNIDKVRHFIENDYSQHLVDCVMPNTNVDTIGYSPLDYALSNRSLVIANKLYKKSKGCCINGNINLNFKRDYLKYCIALKYMSLFKALLQYFVFRDILLREVSLHTNMEQYLHHNICYPHYYKSNPLVSHFMSKFRDTNVLKYVSHYSNYQSDFRYAISFGSNQNVTKFVSRYIEVNKKDIDSNTPLHYAVLHGKRKCVQMLLANDATTDVQNKDGNTPLHLAFMNYNKDNIKLLLAKGANVNVPNRKGETVLHIATQKSTSRVSSKLQFYGKPFGIMNKLFSKGATVNIRNNEGETPLHVAVKNKCPVAVTNLLKHGANLDQQDYGGNTPLHLALIENHLNIAEILITYSANVNIKNKKGATALHCATEKGYSSMVSKILPKSADVNEQNKFGNTPLHLASKEGHAAITKLLLDHGARIDMENINGETALHCAAGKCHYEIASTLLSKGTNVNKQTDAGNTPLHSAVNKETYLVDLNTVKLLISHGGNTNTENANGETVLHCAAKYGNNHVVSELLAKGAEVNKQDCEGNTPLHLTLKVKKVGNIKLRFSGVQSFDISSTAVGPDMYNDTKKCKHIVTKLLEEQDLNNSNTQLYLVSMKGHIETSKLLIAGGTDFSVGNKKGKTPLHYAAENFYNDILLELLAKGADINQQDYGGDTALHLAFRKGHKSTAELLIFQGADANIVNKRGFTAHRYAIHNSLKSAILPQAEKSAKVRFVLRSPPVR